jgi:SAM-dependent methyltransferase
MFHLQSILDRSLPPAPWQEGDNIPWNEPGFSQRMLAEHLSQEHDAASRRFETIDRHVSWIHHTVLGKNPGRILDLGCGPGLYASRLAQLGHSCLGIDYSPASIRYARQFAAQHQLACTYIEQDIRQAEYGTGFDLGMLIYGEFNVFRPQDAGLILQKIHQALKPGGRLLLEPHTFEAVQHMGQEFPTWYTSQGGLFSPRPYIALDEGFWDAKQNVATRRHFVIEDDTGTIQRYAASYQAYSDDEYRALLEDNGFEGINFYPSLEGEGGTRGDFIAIVAYKA